MNGTAANNRARTIRRTANGVLCLAVILPLIAWHVDIVSSQWVGRTTGKMLFWVLLVSGILALVTNKWPEQKKANARLVVAGFFLASAGGSVFVGVREADDVYEEALATMTERIAQKTTLPDSAPVPGETPGEEVFRIAKENTRNRQAAAFDAIDQRFAAIDLGAMLTPAALTSRKAIQASRVAFGRYQALLEERDALAKSAVGENEGLIKEADLRDAVRTRALEQSRQASVATLALVNQFSQSQRAFVKAVQACLILPSPSLAH
jgi:hypothetical protein